MADENSELARMNPYLGIPGFEELVLEESYVLAIDVVPSSVTFKMEFALTPRHPNYSAPPPSEFACFKTGRLLFTRVERLLWERQGVEPATDASGEEDFGHIDLFEFEAGLYHLEGDWGRMEISAAAVTAELD